MPPVIYTIGYERRTIANYVKSLTDAGVTLVVDVREVAWSNRREYAKTALSTALAASGIKYRHLPSAGNPKSIRRTGHELLDIIDLYRKYVRETQSGIPELIEIIQTARRNGDTVAITCYEREAASCHRSVLADHLTSDFPTLRVVHI